MKSLFKKITIAIVTYEAKLVLTKYKPKIIAITGSVGKTGTKDSLYSVLKKTFFVYRSKTSSSNEISVPLAILGCRNSSTNPFFWLKNILHGISLLTFRHNYPQWIILEIRSERPGDIEKVSKWLRADIVIFTLLGEIPTHVEFFDSIEHLAQEKLYLLNSLKEDGLLVLNSDDERIFALGSENKYKIISYGFGKNAEVKAGKTKILYKGEKPTGLSFELKDNIHTVSIELKNVFGKHHIYAALVAYTVGSNLGVKENEILEALAGYVPPAGRLRIVEGIKGSTIIDDTYNSSPVAVFAGLETVKQIKTKGKKIAVLGDMLELGKYTVDAHKEIGLAAGEVVNLLLVVGPRARYITEGALTSSLSEKNIIEFKDSAQAGKYLETVLEDGDIVFVKGSQVMRMERTVEEIMAHPENKKQILVRQEKEWERE